MEINEDASVEAFFITFIIIMVVFLILITKFPSKIIMLSCIFAVYYVVWATAYLIKK